MTSTAITSNKRNQAKSASKKSENRVNKDSVFTSSTKSNRNDVHMFFEQKIFTLDETKNSKTTSDKTNHSITNDSFDQHSVNQSSPSNFHNAVPLPRAVQHCWPALFPTISSAKKSVRKGIFWIRSSNFDPNQNNTENSSFRKGNCGISVRNGDCIRRKMPRSKEEHFRNRGTSTEEVIRRAIGGKLKIAYMDQWLAVVVKPHGMRVNKLADPSASTQKSIVVAEADANGSHSQDETKSMNVDINKNRKTSHVQPGEVSMHELLLHCMPSLPVPTILDSSASATRNEEMCQFENDPLRRPAAIHRLDQPTYGLIIVARTRPTARFLSNIFKERANSLVKRYRAVLHGHIKEAKDVNCQSGTFIRSPLSGKECITEYRIVRRFAVGFKKKKKDEFTSKNNASAIGERILLTLVDLFPHTGRTHQLRRHMASIGHPMVGDTKYGSHENIDELLADHCIMSGILSNSVPSKEDMPTIEGEKSSLPLMLAAVELIFPHPALISVCDGCTHTSCKNDTRASTSKPEVVSTSIISVNQNVDEAKSESKDFIDSIVIETENKVQPNNGCNYVVAKDSQHWLDASHGTLRVTIEMPECMKWICTNA